MGSKEKTTVVQDQNQTQKATATPEEQEYNKLKLDQQKEVNPLETRNIKSGLDLSNLLLQGLNLPGYLNQLPGGIDQGTTDSIVNESMRQIKPGFKQGGILDSGVAASISARTAGDINRSAKEFNINNLMQLLNLAVGGQANPINPILSAGAALSQSLGGLRSINTTGTGSTTTKGMNPFMKSFQTSAGQTLGSPSFKSGGFSF